MKLFDKLCLVSPVVAGLVLGGFALSTGPKEGHAPSLSEAMRPETTELGRYEQYLAVRSETMDDIVHSIQPCRILVEGWEWEYDWAPAWHKINGGKTAFEAELAARGRQCLRRLNGLGLPTAPKATHRVSDSVHERCASYGELLPLGSEWECYGGMDPAIYERKEARYQRDLAEHLRRVTEWGPAVAKLTELVR